MTHEGLKYDRVNIEMRRSKVLSLLAKGLPKQDIARELGVANSTISLDVQQIQCQSQEELEHHISEIIPFHYKICMQGYRDILLAASSIVQNATDDRAKISALSLMANIYDKILATDMHGPTISMATQMAKTVETSRWMLKEMEQGQIQEEQELLEEALDENEEQAAQAAAEETASEDMNPTESEEDLDE
jgi:Bacterial regulatory proteins, luxR family